MSYQNTAKKNKAKKMTVSEKYAELKRQTEQAGMTVKEVNGKLVVERKLKNKP